MKRRVLNSLLSLILVVGLMPLPAYADEPTAPEPSGESSLTALSLSGSGTAEDPYQIGTAADLGEFRDLVNGGSASLCAELSDDIELSGTWTPIGSTYNITYTGTFNGNGHSITGLSADGAAYQGLFGYLDGAKVKNVKVTGAVTASGTSVGGIAGFASGATFENCSFSGSVSSSLASARIGGIVGNVTGAACTITGCVNNASVTGGYPAGIIGYSNQANTITNCYNTGTMTGGTRSAGIVSQQTGGTITNCFNVGEITGSASNKGGIYGFLNSGTITNCYYTSPAEGSEGGTGSTSTGTKVDSMEGMAETLGSAFVEGTSYPTLAWENATAVSKATVTFSVTPEDATITIDGKAATASSQRAAGTYAYTVSKTGYVTATGSFTITEAQAEAKETIPVTVTLEAKTLASIAVSGNDESYFVGDAQPTLTVTATYTDGTTEEVTGFTTDWDSSAAATGKVITVTYQGVTTTFTCDFVEKSGPTAGLNGKADVNLKAGTYGWEEVEFDDETVLRSTNKGVGNSSSTMTITAKQPGMLSFEWKVYSELRYDWVDIQINGKPTTTVKADRSGTIDWTQFSTMVAAGDVVSINYTKDSSGNTGDDAAWLRNFQMAPVYTITMATTPANATVVLKDASDQAVSGTNGVFTVIDGTYSYTVSAFGYETVTGTITVNGANVEQPITLTQVAGQTVTFNVTAPESMSVADAAITVKSGSETVAANADGTYTLPAGDYTYTVTHPNCDDVTGSFTVADAAMTVPVTLERKWVISDYFAGMDVTAENGTYGFVRSSTDKTVLASNNQGKSSSSATLTLTATKAGKLSFEYDVSSELSYDKLTVKVNSTTLVNGVSGEVDWTSATTMVAAGDVITFTYSKDSSGDRNDDTVWLRNFQMIPAYTVALTTTPADATLVLKDASEQVVSGADGVYTVLDGTYSYTASAYGYETATGTITVNGANVEQAIVLTPLPTQTITFQPTLPEGMTPEVTYVVKDAQGTVRDYADGLPAGEYTFTAAAEGCEDATGSFTVVDAAVTVPVTLKRTLTLADFINSDLVTASNDANFPYKGVYGQDGIYLQSTNKGYENATLTITAAKNVWVSFEFDANVNSSTYSTTYGLFMDVNGTNDLTVKGQESGLYFVNLAAGDVLTIKHSCGYSDNDKSVKLSNFQLVPLYAVTMQDAPEGATLQINDAEGNPVQDTNGTYLLPAGTYGYTISAFGYVSKSDTFTATTEDVQLAAALQRAASATITFEAPEGATVAVTHQTQGAMTAEEDGTYVLPQGETFSYTVTKDNYLPAEGGFTVSENATISVELTYAGEAWDGTTKTEPSQVEGVYQISDAAELAWFADAVNGGQTTIKAALTQNINLASKTWTAIGNSSSKAFAGELDGAGKTITGLAGSTGLFGVIDSDGVVKNITASVNLSGTGVVGGIANTNYGTIDSCKVSGSISNTGASGTGGIAGNAQASAGKAPVIRNCVSTADITNTYSYYASELNTAGIVGYTYGPVENCYATGSISADATKTTNKALAGIVGKVMTSSNGTGSVANCYFAGTITGPEQKSAVAWSVASGATVSNSYYLAGCGASDANAAEKGLEQLSAPSFVAVLNGAEGTAWHVDSDGINGGMPVLAWQGGSEYIDYDAQDVAAAKAALKLQGTLNGEAVELTATEGVYVVKTGVIDAFAFAAEGAQGTTIAWAATPAEAINVATGAFVLPAEGATAATVTATISKGEATDTVSFAVSLVSDKQVAQDELNAAVAKVNGKSIWANQIKFPEDLTAVDVITRALEDASVDTDDLTIIMTSAGTKAYPVTEDVNLAADGTITYFTGVEGSNSAKYAQYNDVTFTIAKGEVSATASVRLFIGWDCATIQDALNAAALSVTWDSIKPEGATNEVEYEDANAPAEAGEPVAPVYTVNCDDEEGSNVALASGSVLILPATVGATSVTWDVYGAEEEDALAVEIKEAYVEGNLVYQATLKGSVYRETPVVLVGTFTSNLLNDDEKCYYEYDYYYDATTDSSQVVVDEEGNPVVIEVPTVTTYAAYQFTVGLGEREPIDAEKTQADLESKYEGLITDFVDKTTKPTLSAVDDDLQMPTPSALEDAGIFQDRYFQQVTMTSSDEAHLSFYGYHAQVYRPLPGEDDVTVSYTVTITDRQTGVTYATKTFQMTIKAFTQAELDAAATQMAAVATSDVYWAGMAYEGADKADINQSLKPFTEITWDAEGTLTYVRGAANITFGGIELDDLPGYDPMNYGQSWREIRSSNENVLASESLLFTQPQYDAEVTLDSCMSYTKYAKYWEKFGLDEGATDETKAAYAAFEQFYKQPVSVALQVKGTDGPAPVDPAEDVLVSLTISNAGTLAVSKDGAVMAAISVVAKDLNVDGKVTYDEALTCAHEAYAAGGASDFVIDSYGWVTKFWGVETGACSFLLNGDFFMTLVNATEVAQGDVLYAYVYSDKTGYSDSVAYFDSSAETVQTREDLEVTLKFDGNDENWNPITGVVAGAQLGYMTSTGFVALEGAVTDANGKATVSFAQEGTYVLTATCAGKVITAPYCVVTVEYSASYEVGANTYAGAYTKVTLKDNVAAGVIPVACGVSFVKQADGTFAALMTAAQIGQLDGKAFSFTEGTPQETGAQGDVNLNGRMNIVDAQVAYDLATNKYADFSVLTMAAWLTADMDGDGVVDATDAFAIQYSLHYGN